MFLIYYDSEVWLERRRMLRFEWERRLDGLPEKARLVGPLWTAGCLMAQMFE